MIVRTEAIVLRSINYGETSQIVTLFTRERGQITVMAKGARRIKSSFGSSLQPMSYTQVVFYYKETRDLQTLSESAHVEPFLNIQRNLKKITLGLRIVELTRALTQPEDPQPALFNLLLDVFRQLNASEARIANVLPYFQLRLAGLLGLAPAVERATVERLPDEGGVLALDSGRLLPPGEDSSNGKRASRSSLRAFAVFARADLDDVMRMHLPPGLRRETQALVDDYLRYHLQDAYPQRSREVFRALREVD